MKNFTTQIDEATSGEKPTILGVVALAEGQNGTTILSHAAGKTTLDPATAKPIDQDSILPLASATKLITAIAALRLVQQGKLDLNDTSVVEQHLPELCAQDIFASAPGEPITFEKRKNGITVSQLLTHTSGSGYDMLHPLLLAWRESRGEAPISLSEALPNALAQPGVFQPGEGWTYGGGSDWVGLLISRLTNTSLGDFMQREIFDLVGCDARIGFSHDAVSQHGTIVQIVTRTETGELVGYPLLEQKSERGGGGLFCSSANYFKILKDLIAPDPKILTPATLDLLFAAQLHEGSAALTQLRASSPLFTPMTGPLTASIPLGGINHALGGLLVTQDSEIGETAGTMAWGGAFGSMWFVNRKRGVAAFYGSEVFPPTDGKGSEMMGSFVGEIWGKVGKE
ncbi:beta-lactamase/transpeptidase-like protein [Paraphoma chrysanthemicola]|uniref:Beta-lactamase/transpeptidase-like protein n=1 Tax=Paraphoma chrysanthemicola TaxID=798071 RepID=A0A8K0VZD1_9PLEO|nr:beta-lactamase/transpeptidase-like protein [Paraphoma chrysanthemicola]